MDEDESGPFSNPWNNSDVILVVEDQKLHAHLSILSMASTVFNAMFSSGFKESETKQVELTGKNFRTIENMLKIIYPCHTAENLTLQEMEELLAISDEYMINSVVQVVKGEISRILLQRKPKQLRDWAALIRIIDKGKFPLFAAKLGEDLANLSIILDDGKLRDGRGYHVGIQNIKPQTKAYLRISAVRHALDQHKECKIGVSGIIDKLDSIGMLNLYEGVKD